tara:strand:+ start:1508 stop:2260 length:753 start_codon:yes stop_codon:yes gene_type:complete
MSNIKRIVAFGDSNTFGHGLEDNIIDKNGFEDYNVPSQYAYPVLLGEHFNVPVKNLAIPGCGNETIIRLLCNYLMSMTTEDAWLESHERMSASYCEGDLILIGLSEPTRREIYDNRNNSYHRIIIQHTPKFYDQKLDKAVKRIMVLESDESLFVKTVHQVKMIKSLLAGYDASYMLYHMLPVIENNHAPIEAGISIIKTHERAWMKLLDDNYIPHMIHMIAKDYLKCHHPTKLGHQNIAKFLLEKIDEKK